MLQKFGINNGDPRYGWIYPTSIVAAMVITVACMFHPSVGTAAVALVSVLFVARLRKWNYSNE